MSSCPHVLHPTSLYGSTTSPCTCLCHHISDPHCNILQNDATRTPTVPSTPSISPYADRTGAAHTTHFVITHRQPPLSFPRTVSAVCPSPLSRAATFAAPPRSPESSSTVAYRTPKGTRIRTTTVAPAHVDSDRHLRPSASVPNRPPFALLSAPLLSALPSIYPLISSL